MVNLDTMLRFSDSMLANATRPFQDLASQFLRLELGGMVYRLQRCTEKSLRCWIVENVAYLRRKHHHLSR